MIYISIITAGFWLAIRALMLSNERNKKEENEFILKNNELFTKYYPKHYRH
jgi:hypothetical protein